MHALYNCEHSPSIFRVDVDGQAEESIALAATIIQLCAGLKNKFSHLNWLTKGGGISAHIHSSLEKHEVAFVICANS